MQTKTANYRITTDNMSDMSDSFLSGHGIETVSLSYTIGSEVFTRSNSLAPKAFFDRMRNGAVPTSSQFNPEDAAALFESSIEKYGEDILHISFTSGLSGSYESACAGAALAIGRHPDRNIVVVDSLCASLGQGLILAKAVELKEEKGLSLEELRAWLECNKLNVCHLVTVEDIIYLYRGGRVSRTAAFVSGVLDIKPLIHLDNEGKLVPYGKVRGRLKSLLTLVNDVGKHAGSRMGENASIYICHGDCAKDARFVADEIKSRYGIEGSVIEYVGPTIGAHTGPGLIAVFFMGDFR